MIMIDIAIAIIVCFNYFNRCTSLDVDNVIVIVLTEFMRFAIMLGVAAAQLRGRSFVLRWIALWALQLGL